MPTITQRNGTYRIRVSCGYDSNGKQIMQSKTWKPAPGMTKKQIEKELQRQAVLFEEECDGLSLGGNIKFADFAEQWFTEYAEKRLKARTIARSRQLSVRTYEAIGHLRMDKITTRHVQKFINNLSENGINQKTGKGLAPKTILHYRCFISGIFEYAVRMKMIRDNPCRGVILPQVDHKEHDCYTLEEMQHFLDLLQNEPLKYQAFFVLAVYGGFRRGELLGLEWKDIDFETGVVNIRRTSLYTKEKGIFTDTPKTKGSMRSVKMPPEVISILKRHRSDQSKEIFKLGDQWHYTDRLFTRWNGEPMDTETPYNWLKKFCNRNDMRFLGIHSFRHFNASVLITSGIDARTVSASLGHSNTSTTLNIYAHTFAEAQAKASEAISSALNMTFQKKA